MTQSDCWVCFRLPENCSSTLTWPATLGWTYVGCTHSSRHSSSVSAKVTQLVEVSPIVMVTSAHIADPYVLLVCFYLFVCLETESCIDIIRRQYAVGYCQQGVDDPANGRALSSISARDGRFSLSRHFTVVSARYFTHTQPHYLYLIICVSHSSSSGG